MIDSRSSVRFPLRLPITVRTVGAPLEVGTEIRFRIVLPAVVLGTDTDVLVNCTGRVVRALNDSGKTSVAAVIDEYCFERVLSVAV